MCRVQVGHRVEYKFRKTSDTDPSLCVDGPCIMDPQWGDVYYGGAGVNVTLAETYAAIPNMCEPQLRVGTNSSYVAATPNCRKIS